MTKNDRKALELAIEYASRDPARAEQLHDFLHGVPDTSNEGEWFIPPRPWEEVAGFAASCSQNRSLNLKPWEEAPCNVDEDFYGPDDPTGGMRRAAASQLLRRMLKAGVSRYHPDPLAALAEADEIAREP